MTVHHYFKTWRSVTLENFKNLKSFFKCSRKNHQALWWNWLSWRPLQEKKTQSYLCSPRKWRWKKWQQFYWRPKNCAIVWGFFALFVTYFVHNVSATVSYGRKELLDIRTAITHLGLDNAPDILQTPHRADIPVICKRKQRRYRGQRAGCLVRTRKRRVESCHYRQYYSPTCNHWTIN